MSNIIDVERSLSSRAAALLRAAYDLLIFLIRRY